MKNNNIQIQLLRGKCAIMDETTTIQVLLALHFLMQFKFAQEQFVVGKDNFVNNNDYITHT